MHSMCNMPLLRDRKTSIWYKIWSRITFFRKITSFKNEIIICIRKHLKLRLWYAILTFRFSNYTFHKSIWSKFSLKDFTNNNNILHQVAFQHFRSFNMVLQYFDIKSNLRRGSIFWFNEFQNFFILCILEFCYFYVNFGILLFLYEF